jgi:hypothetical protein
VHARVVVALLVVLPVMLPVHEAVHEALADSLAVPTEVITQQIGVGAEQSAGMVQLAGVAASAEAIVPVDRSTTMVLEASLAPTAPSGAAAPSTGPAPDPSTASASLPPGSPAGAPPPTPLCGFWAVHATSTIAKTTSIAFVLRDIPLLLVLPGFAPS